MKLHATTTYTILQASSSGKVIAAHIDFLITMNKVKGPQKCYSW